MTGHFHSSVRDAGFLHAGKRLYDAAGHGFLRRGRYDGHIDSIWPVCRRADVSADDDFSSPPHFVPPRRLASITDAFRRLDFSFLAAFQTMVSSKSAPSQMLHFTLPAAFH